MSEPFYYRLISEDDVDPAVLRDARCALKYCTRALGLSDVTIQWVRPISRIDVNIEDRFYSIRKITAQLSGEEWPELRYCVSKIGEFWGAVFPLKSRKKIYIRADLSLKQICGVIAHECKHQSEFGVIPINDDGWEARAERFAEETLAVLNIQD